MKMGEPAKQLSVDEAIENIPYSKTMIITFFLLMVMCVLRFIIPNTGFIHLISFLSLLITFILLGAMIKEDAEKINCFKDSQYEKFILWYILFIIIILLIFAISYFIPELSHKNNSEFDLKGCLSDIMTMIAFFIALFQNTISKWISILITS